MTIEYTHRTAEGRKARIICDNRASAEFPVVALIYNEEMQEESLMVLGANLSIAGSSASSAKETPFLIERSIWDDVAVDTPVWVRRQVGERYEYVPYHFAGYCKEYVNVWRDGCTSHTVTFKHNKSLSTHRLLCSDVFLEAPSDA